MGRIKRYRTALSRHHRSKGHGIHSPFAFNFVRFVLREKSHYYCYEDMEQLRQAVIESVRDVKRHPRVVSLKGLKMLFRVTNFFNPTSIFQVGSSYGLTAASMMNVSSSSRLWLYDPELNSYPVTAGVLMPYIDDVQCYNQLDVAMHDYLNSLPSNIPFVLVNSIPLPQDVEPLQSMLSDMIDAGCVIVMRNLHRSDVMKQLWLHLKAEIKWGQTFTNEKTAIVVAQPKLNLEHFFLWF